MGRVEQVAESVRGGSTPSQIAKEIGITLESVLQYLHTAVGYGLVTKSDVLFAIDRRSRGYLSKLLDSDPKASRKQAIELLEKDKIDLGEKEILLFFDIIRSRSALSDLYFYISDLELYLHDGIRTVLKKRYGDGELWWREGVPQKVRVECSRMQEEDQERPADRYHYTTLMNLIEIIDKQWECISQSGLFKESTTKKEMLGDLRRINILRNRVMHPIRYGLPNAEEHYFIKRVHDRAVGPVLVRTRWGQIKEV